VKTIQTKGWYDVIDLQRAVEEIKRVVVETKNFKYPVEMRYLSIVIDQTSGNFAIRDAKGNNVNPEQLYLLYPGLKDQPVTEAPPVDGQVIIEPPVVVADPVVTG
jgi:hypothetical protein